LIRDFLEKAGAQTASAENGRDAVEVVMSHANTPEQFDVILMDMQMPVMDGYEATRFLRAEGYEGPIIALTAHAMADDYRKCLDAGCNGYATKPIEWQKLIKKVAKWTAREEVEEVIDASVEQHETAVVGCKEDVLYSEFGDNPIVANRLPQFIKNLQGRLDALDAAYAQTNWEELCHLAHQLKGAGGSYGYPQITEAARSLEVAARSQNLKTTADLMATVSAACRAAMRGWEIAQVGGRSPAPGTS
jgi:CheY-like chemotaxis protein/HPt (histidine-containing phosphotransfer) domain-containing protein